MSDTPDYCDAVLKANNEGCSREAGHDGDHRFESEGRTELAHEDPRRCGTTDAGHRRCLFKHGHTGVHLFASLETEVAMIEEKGLAEAKIDKMKVNPNVYPGMDEGDAGLARIRELVRGIQESRPIEWVQIKHDLESILNQELRLRAYISGLKAR